MRLFLSSLFLLGSTALLTAQDTLSCSTAAKDLDGDMTIGAGDILSLLGSYGTDLDVDGDSILDCQDDCVGAYDTCGVCNGPGPQLTVIDVYISYDSIYVEAINDFVVYEIADTVITLVCGTLGCTNPAFLEFDPDALVDDGSCLTLPGCSSSDLVSYDGYDYSVVTIGNQCWFAENLRTTVYADSSAIPEITSNDTWINSFGAFCAYGNLISNVEAYGLLYNYYAVENPAGLCPSGWHVPTDGEWYELENYISSQGYSGTEGTALRSTSGWSNGGNGTDDFGFSALPGGFRLNNDGSFSDAGSYGGWWSSSPSGGNAWYRYLYYGNPAISRLNYYPRSGFSVRCLRDAE